jgi:cysteine desulfurase
VIFTSGGTEANNLALRGLTATPATSPRATSPGRLVISAIEHPSIISTAEAMAREGWIVDSLGVDDQGVVHADALAPMLTDQTRLVSVMLGNHETGSLQPVARLAAIARAAGVPIHTDAVQVVGKLRVDFRRLDVDALSCSAHKFHGPHGVGVLVVKYGVRLEPTLYGGFQQAGLRPGTESVDLAVGMHTALAIWESESEQRAARVRTCRDHLEAALQAAWPDAVVNSAAALRLPHVANISFCGLDRQALVMALDLAGVCCSTGSACASGSSDPSPVLLAMGCREAVVASSIRLSLGALTSDQEANLATSRILKVVNELRRSTGGRKMPVKTPAAASKSL